MFNNTTKRVCCMIITFFAINVHADISQSQYETLETMFHTRQYEPLMHDLAKLDSSDVKVKILTVAVAIAQDNDDKEKMLEALVRRYPNNAKVHYNAGELWYQIKEQSSLFNKLGFVDKSNQSYITAAELAPENPKYLVAASKALAIESGFWDSDKKQSKAIVDKLKPVSERYYYLALMDYLQNTQNEPEALSTITTIGSQFSQDVTLMHRAANLLWTFSEEEQAQKLFVDTCKIAKRTADQLPLWRDACISSAYLALQGHGKKQLALEALNLLLEKEQVQDAQHIEYLMVYAQVNKEIENKATAKKAYQQALALAEDRSTQKDIRRALKKLSK
ncbi:hypothetical protein [Pseudoalteromonas sp. MMG012]|uniref:hypothetical protein n=1 Tax=Pseudoalteromonas sp. MMG012 TaxID=2822686 RepID=UPI001B3A72F2|nr:hypothetical protein [Pseudoalteromonas sp. MMG012]MBQ4850857.1 hypothetical protein [Pseudoalteromonas sp. MMG012]